MYGKGVPNEHEATGKTHRGRRARDGRCPGDQPRRTHHPVQAIAPSLSATTVTPVKSTAKHTHAALVSKKHKTLSAHRKATTALSHRSVKHAALSRRSHSHIALSRAAHKATELSSKKKGV